MNSFGLYGIQNVSFVDIETGKKINIENAEVSVLSESAYDIKQEPVRKLNINKEAHFTCDI